MTGVDAAAAAVGAAVLAATRGVPPVMIGTVDRVDLGQAGRSGRAVWVTGLEMERSAVVPVLVWTQAFDDRITAGTVVRGSRVAVATTTASLPVQLMILDLAVGAPVVPALGVATPL